jgi:hypothetical protein
MKIRAINSFAAKNRQAGRSLRPDPKEAEFYGLTREAVKQRGPADDYFLPV